VHTGWLVLGRGVDGIQNQRRGAGVDELVLGAGRDDNQISSPDVLVYPVDRRLALSRREGQDLVDGVFLQRQKDG